MAKKPTTNDKDDNRYQSRQTRKETLRQRKQDEQLRVIRIGAIVVGILIIVVLLLAIISEFVIAPNRSVATVNGENISLSDWQDRVRFERAQRIITLENQLEMFNGDVGPIQQFASQPIIELQNAETLGEAVLEQMVNETLIRQGAEERNLIPTDSEVDERIGASFNYFGGDSPTPFPTPTETVMPTPSLTPIFAVPEATTDPEGSVGELNVNPTSTPIPTPTPVSEESFNQEYGNFIADYVNLGATEATYRNLIKVVLMAEKLTEALASEQALPKEDTHISMYTLTFDDDALASETLANIQKDGYLNVWNTIRSQALNPENPNPIAGTASEILWRTQNTIASNFNSDVAQNAVDLPIDTPSDVIIVSSTDGQPQYVIIMVSGREMRELAPGELQARKQQLLSDYVSEGRLGDVVIDEFWRGRVPVLPALDPKFLQPATPTPPLPDAAPEGSGTPSTDGAVTP